MAGKGSIDMGLHTCAVADLAAFSQLGLGSAPAMILGMCMGVYGCTRMCCSILGCLSYTTSRLYSCTVCGMRGMLKAYFYV